MGIGMFCVNNQGNDMNRIIIGICIFSLVTAIIIDYFHYEPMLSQDLPANLECEYRHNRLGGTQYYCS